MHWKPFPTWRTGSIVSSAVITAVPNKTIRATVIKQYVCSHRLVHVIVRLCQQTTVSVGIIILSVTKQLGVDRHAPTLSDTRKTSQPPFKAATAGADNGSCRLYVRDRVSSLKFLIDTGAEISVVPKHNSYNTQTSAMKLVAANNTHINTYGKNALHWTWVYGGHSPGYLLSPTWRTLYWELIFTALRHCGGRQK